MQVYLEPVAFSSLVLARQALALVVHYTLVQVPLKVATQEQFTSVAELLLVEEEVQFMLLLVSEIVEPVENLYFWEDRPHRVMVVISMLGPVIVLLLTVESYYFGHQMLELVELVVFLFSALVLQVLVRVDRYMSALVLALLEIVVHSISDPELRVWVVEALFICELGLVIVVLVEK